MRKILYKVKFDLYDTDIRITFNKDVMKKITDGKYSLDTCSGLTYYNKGQCYIYIDTEKKDYDVVNTIAHESFHAIDFIFSDRGLNVIPDENNEAWSYAIGYLTGKIYEFYCSRLT